MRHKNFYVTYVQRGPNPDPNGTHNIRITTKPIEGMDYNGGIPLDEYCQSEMILDYISDNALLVIEDYNIRDDNLDKAVGCLRDAVEDHNRNRDIN